MEDELPEPKDIVKRQLKETQEKNYREQMQDLRQRELEKREMRLNRISRAGLKKITKKRISKDKLKKLLEKRLSYRKGKALPRATLRLKSRIKAEPYRSIFFK